MATRGMLLSSLWLGFTLSACLSVDEQTEPGRIELRVGVEPESTDFTTEDGFRIRYETLLVSIGNVRLERGSYDGSCGRFAGTTYLRVVDLLAGRSRVATLFGLDDCTMHFQIMGPSRDPIVTELADEVADPMRVVASDGYVVEQSVALRVSGSAERAGARYRFDWSFRQGFDLDPCALLVFAVGRPSAIEISVRAASLFRDRASGELRFDPFALADSDGDGAVTLEELAAGPLGEPLYFESVPELFWVGEQPPCFVGRVSEFREPPGDR